MERFYYERSGMPVRQTIVYIVYDRRVSASIAECRYRDDAERIVAALNATS